MDISEDDNRDTDLENLFLLTRAYLTNNSISPRVERFHASYLLFLNLTLIFSIGAITHTLGLLVHLAGYTIISTIIPETIVLIVLLLGGAILSYNQRLYYHERMAKVLILDFFADTGNSQAKTS